MEREHEGRACLVIGGSSGIGRGASIALAERGALVAVHGRDDGDAAEVVDIITGSGGLAIGLWGPIQHAPTSEAAVAATVAAFGGLDTLVVSSGIQRYGDVVDTSEVEWDDVFDVNVKGTYLSARSALPHLRRSRAGAIVIVASVQGTATQERVAAYAASKGALLALARSMAVDEAAHGVRVNTVSPGSIDTPMLRASAEAFATSHCDPEAVLAQWGTAHAMQRLGKAEEVGDAVAYLAGPRASFVTGIDLKVDGGMLARLPAPRPSEREGS